MESIESPEMYSDGNICNPLQDVFMLLYESLII